MCFLLKKTKGHEAALGYRDPADKQTSGIAACQFPIGSPIAPVSEPRP
jgi:hypothetical protein